MPDSVHEHRSASSRPRSDEELVIGARSGSVPCFTELIDRYQARIYNFVLRRVGRVADAEDVTQEVFLQAWRALDQYRPDHSFSTWLFTIAGRRAIDHLRARAAHTVARLERAASVQCGAEQEDADDCRRDGQLLWNIATELLSREQHAVLWLRYAEDMSIPEIARVVDRTQVSVRVTLLRARKALAQHAATVLRADAASPLQPRRAPIQGGLACPAR